MWGPYCPGWEVDIVGVSLGNNLSQEDKDRVRGIRHPNSTDAGDPVASDDMFADNLFDDLQDFMGGGGDNQQAQNNTGTANDPFGAFNQPNNGQVNQLGATNFNQQGQPFGTAGSAAFGAGITGYNPNQQAQAKPDNFDKFMSYSGEAFTGLGGIIIDLFKSTKNRTADDIGYFSTTLIKTGLIGIAVCAVLCIIAALVHLNFLGIHGITAQLLLGFALTAGSGMAGIGLAAIAISKTDKESNADISDLSDVSNEIEGDATQDYENNLGDIMDDLFGSDDDMFSLDDLADTPSDTSNENTGSDSFVPNFGTPENITPINFEQALENVHSNSITNRKYLVDTFMNFLPLCTPNFYTRKEIPVDSDQFLSFETMALKALSNLLKCELEEVNSQLVEAYETYFSYEFKLKRVRGLNKTQELARELEVYFRESAYDTAVTASVVIENDFYHIIITKGETAIITIGDTLKQQKVYDFFINEKNKLPIISGVDALGNVVAEDAKLFDTMLIAGKPRSGKSWYVLSILISMMLFNSPEDVQFIIIDPKESNLFKKLALMPHVAGLHNDDDIIEVMDDIIDNEASRRKRLLADNKCDSIWDLKKKGIKIPILYLVIDEYITVKSNCESKGIDKELNSKLQVLISQLPSQGIRLIFVPHRATGVVDKTNRTMLQFTASVKGDSEDVIDTLGIKKWDRALVNPGDIAIKSSSMKEAIYVRSVAFGTSDEENSELIETVAKAFYKMGVDMPDMSTMEVACNRDERYISETLGQGNRVQYDARHIFDDLN